MTYQLLMYQSNFGVRHLANSRYQIKSNQIKSDLSGDRAGSLDLGLDMKRAALGFIPIRRIYFTRDTVQQHNEYK